MSEELKNEPSVEDMSNSIKIVEIEAKKGYLHQLCKESSDKMAKLKSTGFNPDETYDLDAMLLKKVEGMTSDEVREKAKNVEWLNEVYTIPETGEVIRTSDVIPKNRINDFRASYLIYSVETEETLKKIDEEYAKLDDALKEFDEGTKDAYLALSNNILEYTKHIRTKYPDDKEKLEICKYIESGYNLQVLFDVLEEHPSVIANTISDLKRESRIKAIGKRYAERLKRVGTEATLLPFLSGKDIVNSVEYKCLPKGSYQEGREDFFIFSCIRYFSMADWETDTNVSKFHASLILVLKRLLNNELEGDAYNLVINSITKYMGLFK